MRVSDQLYDDKIRSVAVWFDGGLSPCFGLCVSQQKPGCLFVTGFGPWRSVFDGDLPVPIHIIDGLQAGEDWRPAVDCLLETYPDQMGWLADLVARLSEEKADATTG